MFLDLCKVYYLTMVTGLVGGLLADVILKKADYKSAKSTVLSCGVFSIWVFGNFAPIFLNRESYTGATARRKN